MKYDVMLSVEESHKIRDALGKSVTSKELDGGHVTYFIAKDVSFMYDDILVSLSKYNPLNVIWWTPRDLKKKEILINPLSQQASQPISKRHVFKQKK